MPSLFTKCNALVCFVILSSLGTVSCKRVRHLEGKDQSLTIGGHAKDGPRGPEPHVGEANAPKDKEALRREAETPSRAQGQSSAAIQKQAETPSRAHGQSSAANQKQAATPSRAQGQSSAAIQNQAEVPSRAQGQFSAAIQKQAETPSRAQGQSLAAIQKQAETPSRAQGRSSAPIQKQVALMEDKHNTSKGRWWDSRGQEEIPSPCEDPAILEDLASRYLNITRVTDGDHAYVACETNLKIVQKISCEKYECDGDAWCFVENGCGSFLNACHKLQGVVMNCKPKPVMKPRRNAAASRGASAAAAALLATLGIIAAVDM